MAISWNEIKHRARDFCREWDGESRERAETQTFWNRFFNIFGISRRHVASFGEPVKKIPDTFLVPKVWVVQYYRGLGERCGYQKK